MLNKGQYALAPADCPCVAELAPHARQLSDGRFIVSITPSMPLNSEWEYIDHATAVAVTQTSQETL